MPRPNVFPVDTTLYHPTEGKRVFPAGETDPGPLWRDRPGIDVISDATKAQALEDLMAAQEAMDELEARLLAAGRDLDEATGTREAALAKVHGLEQDLVAANKRADEAEALAREYMAERDQARSELTGIKAQITKKKADA